MTTAMKYFLRSLALLAVLACTGQNATAQQAGAQPAWNEVFLAQDNQRPGPRITVADATELVQRQTGGRVLNAQEARQDGRRLSRKGVDPLRRSARVLRRRPQWRDATGLSPDMRVLVIEDEPSLQAQVRARLEADGYVVDACADGNEGLYLAAEYPLSAAIVDLGLPGLSGIDIIKRLRQRGSALPILILTARGRWQDKVEGLEAGADDYLVKPFQMEELLARLKALLRRAVGSAQNTLQLGPVKLDFSTQKVSLDGSELALTTFEYRLLEYLVKQRDRVVPKDELADYLYPHDEDRDSNVIEVLIGRLRRKLDPAGTLSPIETLRGRGYRLTLGVTPR